MYETQQDALNAEAAGAPSWVKYVANTSNVGQAANQQGQKQQTSGGFNMPTGSFSPIRYGTSFINNTVGGSLGFGPGYSFVGPMQPSSAFTGASLTGTLTAAGLGYMGGGYLAGLMGGNEQTGSIGGGIGSAAGYVLMGANPILGAIAGGVAGSVLGGMMGKKKPSDKTMAGGIDLETGQVNRYYADRESSTGKKYSDTGAQLRDAVETGASKFAQFLLANGATPLDPKDNNSQQEMAFVIGGRDGYRLFTYDRTPESIDPATGKDKVRISVDQHKNYKNFGNDYNAYSKGIVDQMLSMYNVPDELRAQIEAMNITDIASFGQPQQGQGGAGGGTYSGARDVLLTPRNKDDSQSFKDFLTTYRSKYNANAVK